MIRQLVWSYVLLVAVAIAAFTVPVAFTLNNQLYDDAVNTARREADTAALLLASGDTRSLSALGGRLRTADAGQDRRARPGAGIDGLGRRGTEAHGAGPDAGRHGRRRDPAVLSGRSITERLWQIWGFRAALAVAVLIVAAFLGVWLARRLTRPLRELNAMAGRLRDGDLTARAEETGPPETRTLARTLNTATETIGTLVGSQRAFIGDASHQLRTPLTALRLSLDNVADGVDDPVRPRGRRHGDRRGRADEPAGQRPAGAGTGRGRPSPTRNRCGCSTSSPNGSPRGARPPTNARSRW